MCYHSAMACVYTLSRASDLEVRYIGISKYETAEKRFKIHARASKHGVVYPIYDWMRKYDDVTATTVATNLSWEEACKIEIKMIAEYRSIKNNRLLNLSDGGQGPSGYKHSEESLHRLSTALKGRSLTDEHRRNISAGQTGRAKTSEHRKNISKARKGKEAPNKGNVFSDEQKKKVSEGLKLSWARRKALKEL